LTASAEQVAEDYAGSVSQGVGQFCTNPGLIIAKQGAGLDTFKKVLADKLKENPPGCMLNPRISESYQQQRAKMFSQAGSEVLAEPVEAEEKTRGAAAVASTTADKFLANEVLGEEVFGPYTLVLSCKDEQQMRQVASQLEGQLTITLMGHENERSEEHTSELQSRFDLVCRLLL